MGELLVAMDTATRFLARAAELGAGGAGDDVVRRAAKLEVRAGLTDLGAVEQNADEIHIGVIAAGDDAVLERHRADGVAVEAFLDALLELVVRFLVGVLVGVIVGVIVVDLGHLGSVR